MSFALGVFDVFAYMLPGSLYVTVVGYVLVRLNRWDVLPWLAANVLTAVLLAAVLSFFVGHLSYGFGRWANRLVPGYERRGVGGVRADFLRRNPTAAGRRYLELDPFLLLAKIQLSDGEVATEISRLRSFGLMLRHSFPPLSALAVVCVVEAVAAPSHRWPALAGVLLFGASAYGALSQGREKMEWAVTKTLEVAYWVEGADGPALPPPVPPATP